MMVYIKDLHETNNIELKYISTKNFLRDQDEEPVKPD